jgi:hypothetical protein
MKSNNPLGFFIGLLLLPLPLIIFLGGVGFLLTSVSSSPQIESQRTQAFQSTEVAQIIEETAAARITSTPEVVEVSFSQDVLPIFQIRCAFCHGPNSIAGAPPNGLELNNYDNVMRGSNFFPVIQAGNPQASSIILLLRSGGMPASASPDTPPVPLPEEQIDLIALWIEQGAKNN